MSTDFYILVVPVVEKLYGVMTVVVYAMLAVWAVESRWHWFLRAVTLGTALGALLVLPAPELAIRIGIAQAIFAAGLGFWRQRERNREPEPEMAAAGRRWPRVGLRDLMLMMIVVAAALAVCVNSHNRNPYAWLFTFVDGLVIALMGWACVWLACGRARPAVRLAVAPLVFILSSIAAQVWLYWFTYGLTSFSHNPNLVARDLQAHWADRFRRYYVTWPQNFWQWAAAVTIGSLVFVAWLWFTRSGGWFGRRSGPSEEGDVHDRGRRNAYLTQPATVFTVIIVGPMVYLWSQVAIPTALPAEAAEFNQNYVELVAVAEEIYKLNDGKTDAWISQVSDAQFAAAVSKHDSQWRRVRAAITGGVKFPWRPVDALRTGELRLLSFVLIAKANRGDGTGTLEPQIEACLDGIRLGANEWRSTSHYGGDFRVVASDARELLWNLRSSFSVEQCKQIIERVWDIEQQREPFEESIERSRQLLANASWENRLSLFTEDWFWPRWLAGRIFRLDALAQRMLLTELAILAFEKEHRRLPDTTSEIVPDYLPALPADPFANSPLQYRRTEGGYLLYSFGIDGVDNDGKAVENFRKSDGTDLPSSSIFPPPRTPPPAAK